MSDATDDHVALKLVAGGKKAHAQQYQLNGLLTRVKKHHQSKGQQRCLLVTLLTIKKNIPQNI